MTILSRIVAYKRNEELPQRMAALPLEEQQGRAVAAPPPRPFAAALKETTGVSLIAEVKKASPSRGLLRTNFDPLELAEAYCAGGASAISVLTDERFFQGSLAYLEQIRRRFPQIPLLRKDFIVHPYQIYEARAAGADALLLIAACLSDEEMSELLALTHSLGMDALVEVHDAGEVERVLPLRPRLVGINNRNLHDFSVDLNTCLALRAWLPAEICLVAESGIHTRADMARLAAAGVDAALVGEALVTASNVPAKVRELLHDG